MLMKNKLIIAVIAMSALLGCTVSSCSKDTEDDPIENGTQNDEAKKFIGTWYSNATSGGRWTFNEDGTCSFSYNSSYTGEWSYAADAKILTTTILNWNWEVYAISNSSWTGKHLAGKGTTFTYTRISD